MTTRARRKRTGRPRKQAPRHPGGQIRREPTLPSPEIIAKRLAGMDSDGTDWQDQRAGTMFGCMLARKIIDQDQHNAGMAYGERCAAYEALIGSPRGFGSRPEGRSLTADDPARYVCASAEFAASRQALRHLDHRCTIALSRAVAEMPEALLLAEWIGPALTALHRAADDIRRAGRTALQTWRGSEAA